MKKETYQKIFNMAKVIRRKDVLQQLIDNDIKTIIGDYEKGSVKYITEILTIGFKGYDYFTNHELEREYKATIGEDIIVD